MDGLGYLTTQIYGMHQMVPTIYYHFWVRYHPSRVYSQKKLQLEAKYRSLFPTTIKPHPLNPLDRGSTFVVLAGYKLVVLRPLCACSTIFCFCLLPFPLCFCCNKLALFCSAACLCLIFSCVSYYVCHFLQFGFSFLHAIPTTDTSYCSLFLFIVLLHISFHTYLLYKRLWVFVGKIMLTGSKGSWAQFSLICRGHSAKELYFATDLKSTADLRFAVDCFPLHFFLWTFLALRSSWWVFGPCFSLGFPPYGLLGKDLKNGHQQ